MINNSYLIYITSYRHNCISAATKCYKYLRKLLKFEQMDFEFALWQMIFLFTAPQKVYRNFQSRKRKYSIANVMKEIIIIELFIFRNKVTICKRWSSIFSIINMLALYFCSWYRRSFGIRISTIYKAFTLYDFCWLHRCWFICSHCFLVGHI